MKREVVILEPVRKLIGEWPDSVRRELGTLLLRLQRGEFVGMPDMKAMPSVQKGAFEIRIKVIEGTFRFFHMQLEKNQICVFHAFVKKTRQTPKLEIETARARIKFYLGLRK